MVAFTDASEKKTVLDGRLVELVHARSVAQQTTLDRCVQLVSRQQTTSKLMEDVFSALGPSGLM